MRKRRILLAAVLVLPALFVWAPLWLLLSGTLMGEQELVARLGPVLSKEAQGFASWPLAAHFPTLSAYARLLLDTPEFFVMFWNSCRQVFPALLLQVVTGAPAAWAFARFTFPGKKPLWLFYIALMLLPFQVTMVSNYLVLDTLKLTDTVWAIILPAAFSTFPVFIITRFFAAIPEALLEAASLDGCGMLRSFFYIGLPLGAAGILSAVVLGFLECWNALEQPLAFLKDKTLWPLSLYLPNISVENAGVSLVASALMLTPALLIFLFGQKYLEQGISASGLRE